MCLSHFIYIIVSIAAITKCNAEEDNLSVLYHLRRSDLIVRKAEESLNQKAKRTLNVATKRLFETVSRVLEEDCCCCCDNDNNTGGNDDTGDDNNGGNDDTDDDNNGDNTGDENFLPPNTSPSESLSASPTKSPSPSPSPSESLSASPSTSPSESLSASPSTSIIPSQSPSYVEKDFFASDRSGNDYFGASCSITDHFVVFGAPNHNSYNGAAYLFSLDGTEVSKLEPGDDENPLAHDGFGAFVSMDKKIVVGAKSDELKYIRIFSLEGIYERTLTCDNCDNFGAAVVTLGDKIVTSGVEDDIYKLFIYNGVGVELKELVMPHYSWDLAISDEFIVSVPQNGNTIVYANEAPDYLQTAEIDQRGYAVAVSGNRVVIGHSIDGAAWLYNTDGSLVKELDGPGGLTFGVSVAITEDRVFVGKSSDDSIYVYSAVTGDLIEQVEDEENDSDMGKSVCVSESYFATGAVRAASWTGAGRLFNLPP